MTNDQRLLGILISIGNISNNKKLTFGEKIQHILLEIIKCMRVKHGSIMLLKNPKSLQVVASTNPKLINVKQPLNQESPSCWVVRNKGPLYIDKTERKLFAPQTFHRYKKDAYLLVPIASGDKVIGVLSVTEKIGPDRFAIAEQEIFLRIASQVISTLENQRLAESLKKSKRILHQKNLQLRKLEKLKTELFNMLIHDLKGPISEVVANLDILSYIASEENREYVESAQTGCDTLYRMVSNLLDIARMEEGKFTLASVQIEPQDFIKEALARLFGLAKIKNLRFVEKFIPSEANDIFWGDRSVLSRVLQNLLSNAMHYSPPGETIEVGFQYLGSSAIEFFVKDNGPGVPAEFQQVIFDKYTQLENKSDGRIYTTGLGLTFCKEAVEAHRGKINVQSEGIRGSRFYFVLPLGKDGGQLSPINPVHA